MKKFDIPSEFRSTIIGSLKNFRKTKDPRKQNFEPSEISFGKITFVIPRHFGFCYGVENAIEISYKAIKENPGKRIFLLSQMIHNPAVNEDLQSHGIDFIMDTEGQQLIEWNEVKAEDVVIIPAFGTTIEIENLLKEKGVETQRYNTTCPFVEKVWKRSAEIGKNGYTNIIHGKYKHEETRATFSHSNENSPSLIIRDMKEAEVLADFITQKRTQEDFETAFAGKYSKGFDAKKDLSKIGVVNQTTMLATETQEIADYLKKVIEGFAGEGAFADTRDTLCYATNDNQQATLAVLDSGADLAIVVGGYNSSNTSQLATILSEKMPVYFIKDESEILSENQINHFIYKDQALVTANAWLPAKENVKIVVTSGASCPDTVVEEVLRKVLAVSGVDADIQAVLEGYIQE
ncbi:MAG: 4-hydroxy-3-methylbut-2-enyl diphosphate reductase [Flavobacteriales bacterium]